MSSRAGPSASKTAKRSMAEEEPFVGERRGDGVEPRLRNAIVAEGERLATPSRRDRWRPAFGLVPAGLRPRPSAPVPRLRRAWFVSGVLAGSAAVDALLEMGVIRGGDFVGGAVRPSCGGR